MKKNKIPLYDGKQSHVHVLLLNEPLWRQTFTSVQALINNGIDMKIIKICDIIFKKFYL